MPKKILLIGNPHASSDVSRVVFNLPYSYYLIRDMISRYVHCDFLDFAREMQILGRRTPLQYAEEILSGIGDYDVLVLSHNANIDYATDINGPLLVASFLKRRNPLSRVILGGPGVYCGLRSSLKDTEGIEVLTDNNIKALLRRLDIEFEDFNENMTGDFKKSIFGGFPRLSKEDISRYEYTAGELLDFVGMREHFKGFDLDYPISVMPYFFSYGCQNTCAYCCNSTINLTRLEAVKVLEDIRSFNKIGVKNFFFMNSTLNSDIPFMESIVDGLDGIRWSDCMEPRNINQALFSKLKKSGCVRISYGLESGSESLRRRFGKTIKDEEMVSTIRLSHEAGIWNHATMILGLPYESDEDFSKTISMVRENINFIDQFSRNIFLIYGTSKLYKEPEKYGIRFRDSYSQVKGSFYRSKEFDEINGYPWFVKKRKTESRLRDFNRLFDEMLLSKKQLRYTENIPLHYLIILDEFFRDKQDALNFLEKVC